MIARRTRRRLHTASTLQACSLIKRRNRLRPLAPAILPIWPNRLRPGAPIGPRWFLAGRGVSPLAHTGGVTHRFFIARFPRVDARFCMLTGARPARSASRWCYLRPFRVSRHYLLITLLICIEGALYCEPHPLYRVRIVNPEATHHHFHHHHRVLHRGARGRGRPSRRRAAPRM